MLKGEKNRAIRPARLAARSRRRTRGPHPRRLIAETLEDRRLLSVTLELDQKVLDPSGNYNDVFGFDVAIDGEVAVVGARYDDPKGADSGSAHVYRRQADGSWTREAQLVASNGYYYDWFSHDAAIEGDWLLLGADGRDNNGPESGGAYAFHYEEVTPGTRGWAEKQLLLAGDGQLKDWFGNAIDIDGNWAVIAAYGDDDCGTNSGSAYFFHLEDVGGGHWQWLQKQKVLASDGTTEDYFGYSVSVSGDWAVVGARDADGAVSETGAAYLFHYEETAPGSGTWQWVQKTKLVASDGVTDQAFGAASAIDGDWLVVGAYAQAAGAVYVFRYQEVTAGSWEWIERATLTASDGQAGDYFGCAVDLEGDYLVVGAQEADVNPTNAGAAYVFQRQADDSLSEVLKLQSPEPVTNARVGLSIGISGQQIVVGASSDTGRVANTGATYFHNLGLKLANVVATSTINENEEATLSGNFVTVDALAPLTLVIDWGDGIVDTIDYPPGTTSFSTNYRYADDGVYTVTLTVEDEDGSTDTVSHEVTILDLGPAPAFDWSPEPQDEGAAVEFVDQSTSWPDEIVSWSWDFAGLGTSSDQHPEFTFPDDGVYTVTLTVEDEDGSTDTIGHDVTIVDLGPMAAFDWSPGPQDEGAAVEFVDQSTSWPDEIVSWSWDFGGLGTSSEQHPEFTFLDDGVYTVTLTVEDEDGSTDTIGHDVTIVDLGPTAAFDWSPEPQDEGAAVEFVDQSTSWPDEIVSWSWDFGGLGTSSEQHPEFTFPDDGVYTVTLTVEDEDGSTDTVGHDVTIVDLGPMAAFDWSPEPQDEGAAVEFEDQSTSWPDEIVSWSWDFGGLDTSSDQHPEFTFPNDGVYTVTLTVADDDGSEDMVSHEVTVVNVAPTVDAGPDVVVGEGRTLDACGTFTDPGADVWTATVNYGDGTGDQPLIFDPLSKILELHHTYAANGTYTVTVTVEDDDGGWHSDTMQAYVGLNLTSEPAVPTVAGWTTFMAFNATPGGLVDFVLGTQEGAGQVKVKRQPPVEVDILKPRVVAQAVVDATGQAVAIIDLIKYAGQTVYVQAFEQKPVRQVSNLMTIVVPPLPQLSIGDVRVDENDPDGQAVFAVTLWPASDREVRVKYATANGTARSRYDYTGKRGTLRIPAGATSGKIIVPIKNDTKHEDPDPEVFYVNLSRPKNATLADNQATGTIWDDDPAELRLAAAAGRGTAADTLSAAQLAAATDEAIRRWASVVGDQAAAGLSAVTWELADLPGNLLGLASDRTVIIDRDAAGRGWFVDASPWDDEEFLASRAADVLRARRGGAAADRVDLLTAVMHELGHVLGLPDVAGHGDDLMHDSLGLGQRRLPQ